MLARDARMSRVIARGAARTSADRDYTVKVDAAALEPGTTYYYRFAARGAQSPVGRTRTLPTRPTRGCRLALVSCSNLPFGFFNVYNRVAARPDLDAVLHLGDYITSTRTTTTAIARRRWPPARPRAVSRSRDHVARGLSRALRAVPRGRRSAGRPPPAPVHRRLGRPRDGEQLVERRRRESQPARENGTGRRAAAAFQAWREWMPVRETPGAPFRMYRQFAFGDLADLLMLDTRIEGRDQQVRAR